MKKALITGVTGQDGSYLAELLLDKRYEVHGLVRRSATVNTQNIEHLLDHSNFTTHYGDLSDSASIIKLLNEIKPDEVYNIGAQSHVRVSFDVPEYTADVSGLGCVRILEAIRTLGLDCKFYQASTSEMFGNVQEIPQTEKTPFYPRSPYGFSKLLAHWATVNYRESYGMFACSGILFNHESPRRGEKFVTRKITKGIVDISQGIQDCLYLGRLDTLRDWGHAKDYVRLMWMMLQADKPEDYVIATGVQHSVKEWIEWSCEEMGIEIVFEGEGKEEVGKVVAVTGNKAPCVKPGDIIIRINPDYYRPAEVDSLIGDSSKAQNNLGWQPSVTARELCAEMIAEDFT